MNKICTCACHQSTQNVDIFDFSCNCCKYSQREYIDSDGVIDFYTFHLMSTNNILLSRDDFRENVFKRDNYKCIICGNTENLDAHHIMERRLFSNGGYYIDNGATLCSEHHLDAEKTIILPQQLRDILNIKAIILPEHLYTDNVYDKWGNIILQNGQRLKGELFNDPSVQKILKGFIDQNVFIDYVKYPRTYHLPWTGSKTTDDKILKSTDIFKNKDVVVTEKLDGENTNVYSDGYFHARSIDGNSHPSQAWFKNYMQTFYYNIPDGWRICGENLYATHAIKYNNLKNYFQVFSIWNENNICLSWNETVEWCELLGLTHVPILYRGVYDETKIRNLTLDYNTQEGYIVRISDQFHYSQFKNSIAKYVRRNHVNETVHNWRNNWNKFNINTLKV